MQALGAGRLWFYEKFWGVFWDYDAPQRRIFSSEAHFIWSSFAQRRTYPKCHKILKARGSESALSLWHTEFWLSWKASFGNFFLSIVSVFNMFLFDIWGICAMISSINVASIKPEVSEFFRCLLISLRLSDSDKNFLTLRMTVVLLFFFLGFFLCSSLTMCLFRLKAELNVLEHSLHRCLSATLTFFSLTKVPKPAADFTFFTWFSLYDDLFSWVFTCLSYPYFDVCLVSHLSQFQDYFTLSGFCLCTCFLCLSTFDLTSLS